MLVLSRKTNERIVIGDGVEIMVIGVQGQRVRLGVSAPAELSIRRSGIAQPDGLGEARQTPRFQLVCAEN